MGVRFFQAKVVTYGPPGLVTSKSWVFQALGRLCLNNRNPPSCCPQLVSSDLIGPRGPETSAGCGQLPVPRRKWELGPYH